MTAIVAPAPAAVSIWTITANPSDVPGKHVARRHECRAGGVFATGDHRVADTLDEVRAMLPSGLTRFPSDLDDDPVIVESWP